MEKELIFTKMAQELEATGMGESTDETYGWKYGNGFL